MAKKIFVQVRSTEEERERMHNVAQDGDWRSVSEMVRDLVNQVASKQGKPPLDQIAQHQPDPQPDAPPL